MSITSISTPILNDMAKTQILRTKWANKVFPMSPDDMAEAESQEYLELIAKGIPHEVASPFLDMKPLLLENRAISRYIQATGRSDLRAALPEIVTVSEAVELVLMEKDLTRSEQDQLAELLEEALPEVDRDFEQRIEETQERINRLLKHFSNGKNPKTFPEDLLDEHEPRELTPEEIELDRLILGDLHLHYPTNSKK